MVKTERRPSTATLTKPSLLDTKLLGIFDMTTVSREHLLAIKNLVHSTPRCKCIPVTKTFLPCEDCKSSPPEPQQKMPKMYNVLNRTYRIRTNVRQRLQEMATDEVAPVPVIPAPCVTCGRPELPERFHSHPSRVDGPLAKPKPELEKRKTVQKPVAMKFRSKTKPLDAIREQPKATPRSPPPKEIKSPRKKGPAPLPPSSPAPPSAPVPAPLPAKSSPGKENVSKSRTKLSRWRDAIKKSVQSKRVSKAADEAKKQHTPREGADSHVSGSEGGYKLDSWIPAPVSGGRTRKVVCYLCSQEFGTAALPSHEAQCIQKYLKETTDSDNSLRNDETEREPSAAQENWNLAWEITQASLIPCEFCDRKFLPGRIEAHQKICASKSNKEPTKNKALTNSGIPQPGILCENCGKRYGSSSIAIHREQCAKKLQNVDQLPSQPPQVSRKPSPPVTVICYICGRNFGTKSIGFHEPQCLKKWKMENDKLPAELQRPTPIKVEELNSQGSEEIDSDCQELFWRAHQAQLVPCSKCARTFYPDRLEIHLKGCKGPSKNKLK